MSRARLPARRPSVTREVVWAREGGMIGFTATVGFNPVTGRAAEVFAGGKTGTDMGHLLADACVLVSLALQHGAEPRALARSLLKVPLTVWGGDEVCAPASAIGVIVETLIEIEGELP